MNRRVLILSGLILAGCLLVCVTYLSRAPYAAPTPVDGVLAAPGVSATQPMLFAVDEAAFWRIVHAKNAQDYDAYMDEVTAGAAFLVTNGARVRIIDSAAGARRVRVLDGPYRGKAGWVPAEWVR